MKVSAIIATKNEVKTIGEIVKKTKELVDEVIVVDGNSSDHTLRVAKKAGAICFSDTGKGKGEAIRIGIQKAKGEILVFIDGDGSHEIKDILRLIDPIKNNKADLVVASRGKGGSDELHGSLEKTTRLIGSAIITLVINLRFKTDLTDSQNGFRAIKKSVAQKLNLKENIFTVEQEMIMKTLKKGHIIFEIPSHEYKRKYGKSNISLTKMSWRYVWSLIKYIF